MADLPPLPPRKTDQPRPLPARPVSNAARSTVQTPRSETKPNKPDARPMRVAYGAGAVAVASVMAVGLIQPDFTATADQQASTDPNAADIEVGQGNAGNKSNDTSQADVQVNHVTKYIHLKPGQTAPPGATVIQANQPAQRTASNDSGSGVAHNPPPQQNNNPAPAPKPPPPPPPPPPKPPVVRTHQSGHP